MKGVLFFSATIVPDTFALTHISPFELEMRAETQIGLLQCRLLLTNFNQTWNVSGNVRVTCQYMSGLSCYIGTDIL